MEVAVLSLGAMPGGSQAGLCGLAGFDGINRFFFQETDDEVLSSHALFLLWG